MRQRRVTAPSATGKPAIRRQCSRPAPIPKPIGKAGTARSRFAQADGECSLPFLPDEIDGVCAPTTDLGPVRKWSNEEQAMRVASSVATNTKRSTPKGKRDREGGIAPLTWVSKSGTEPTVPFRGESTYQGQQKAPGHLPNRVEPVASIGQLLPSRPDPIRHSRNRSAPCEGSMSSKRAGMIP